MFQMSHVINDVNQAVIAYVLRSWIRRLGFKDPLLWIYTPSSAKIVDKVPNAGAVYECVDEFRAPRRFVRSAVVGAMEDALLRKVQLTVVTHDNLLWHRSELCSKAVCIPNGVDIQTFKTAADRDISVPSDIARIRQPRFGFVGHVHYWIDLKLIRFLADRRPDWSFVLIGPTHMMASARELRRMPNVHFLGPKPHSEIPAYVKAMDCCLNPYVTGRLADHVSPLKLYEYLAAGKPVVSTEMPEAHKFGNLVRVANSYATFIKECEAVLALLPEPENAIRQRRDAANEHSWEERFRALQTVLQGVFSK
jgi:glycosyltransferase involved in cell wall biosynthesis